MLPILIALFVFVAVGVAASLVLRRGSGTKGESRATERGAGQLGELRWRDFTKLVLQAMSARGYEVVVDEDIPADGIPTDGGDILLERNGEQTLLSCKYGSASVVGAPALLGLAKSATLRGAARTVVVTPGRFDEEAKRMARQQGIELIDGEDLWPEVRPYVAHPEPEAGVTAAAVVTAPPARAMGLAWGGAAAVAAIAWMLAQGLQPDEVEAQPVVASERPQAVSPPPGDVAAAPAPTPAGTIPTDPIELEQRRRETASAISTLFGVDRAMWTTQSTLMVYLSSETADPINNICPLLERYPELAASRVQLQPPAGSTKAVRFKQCRAY